MGMMWIFKILRYLIWVNNVREYIHSNDVNTFFNLNPTNSTSSMGTARNIIVKSKNFDVSKKTLYLSAHYDTTSGTTACMIMLQA